MPEVTDPFRPVIVTSDNPQVKLSCRVSQPCSAGVWYMNDGLVKQSDRVKFGVDGHTHYLEVSNVTSSDLGVYSYRVENVAVSAVILG